VRYVSLIRVQTEVRPPLKPLYYSLPICRHVALSTFSTLPSAGGARYTEIVKYRGVVNDGIMQAALGCDAYWPYGYNKPDDL